MLILLMLTLLRTDKKILGLFVILFFLPALASARQARGNFRPEVNGQDPVIFRNIDLYASHLPDKTVSYASSKLPKDE